MSNNCWICNSKDTNLIKKGINPQDLNSSDFMVTDSKYGLTLDVFECNSCSFQFCPIEIDLVGLYEKMDDPEYLSTSPERAKQSKDLYDKSVKFFKKSYKKTLDIGCGSGLLVENFNKNGFDATGIEPSKSLSQYGINKGLNIVYGDLSDLNFSNKYDFISLIDVIEHVKNPAQIIEKIYKLLKPGGSAIIVTPRKDSFFKKLLGFKWWHYRIAHVGYFSRSNLIDICERNNLKYVDDFSPSWYFPLNYVINRIFKYIPFMSGIKINWFKNYCVKLNLRDSIALIVSKK